MPPIAKKYLCPPLGVNVHTCALPRVVGFHTSGSKFLYFILALGAIFHTFGLPWVYQLQKDR